MNCFDIICKIVDVTGAEKYDCGDNVAMCICSDMSEDVFFECEKELEKSGYVVSQRHDIAGNIHFTLKGNNETVQFYYNPCSSSARLIADGYTADIQTQPTDVSRVCNTEIYQFETDHSLIDCGMCYIIRCADNSFFVIDSAHFYSVHDNDRIHDFLRAMTPENEKIHISGWFLSHGHDDHICKCTDYILYNMKDTVIDKFYYNFVPDTHRDNENWDGAGKGFRRSFYKAVNESGVPVVKLHTGQRFYVGNLEFEVLCTHEDVWPASCADYNNSSTVLMMKTENTKVLFPEMQVQSQAKSLKADMKTILNAIFFSFRITVITVHLQSSMNMLQHLLCFVLILKSKSTRKTISLQTRLQRHLPRNFIFLQTVR